MINRNSIYSLHTKNIPSKFHRNLMNQIQDMLQTVYLGTKYGLNDGHARARMGEHVTKLIRLHSLYTKNISSKFPQNLMNKIRDILKKVYFGTKYGLNDGHARERMGEHMTKLISLHSLYTKNIFSKFPQNLMNQIRDILKKVYFGTKYGLIWA